MSSLSGSPVPSRRSPWWMVLALLLTIPLFGSQLKRLRMENNVDTWLPDNDGGAQVLTWYQKHFEPNDRLLVSWDDSSLADHRVRKFVAELKSKIGDHQLIDSVAGPHDVLGSMIRRKIEPDQAFRSLSGVLLGKGTVCVRLTPEGEASERVVREKISQYLQQRWDITPTFLTPADLHLAPPVADGPAETATPEESASSESSAKDDSDNPANDEGDFLETDWHPPEFHFLIRGAGLAGGSAAVLDLQSHLKSWGPDQPWIDGVELVSGFPVAVAVTLGVDGGTKREESIALVVDAAQSVGIPEGELRLAGAPVVAARLNAETNRSFWNNDGPAWQLHQRSPVILSAIVGSLLACLLLQSLRLAILVLATSIYTATAVVALVPVFGDTLNMILIVMPNLLMVLTMSGTVHLANYWKHSCARGELDPIRDAVRMAAEPCLLASFTTAIGMLSLMTSQLLPVRQFGIYSAIGCVMSVVTILLIFPALLHFYDRVKRPPLAERGQQWENFGRRISRNGQVISLLCFLLFVVGIGGLYWFRTETKAIRYFNEESRVVQDYHFLEDNISGIVTVDVLLRFDQDQILKRDILERIEFVRMVENRLREVDGITGTLSLADFQNPADRDRLPAHPVQRRRRLNNIQNIFFVTHADQTKQFARRAETPLDITEGTHRFQVAIDDEVWRIRAQSAIMTDTPYAVLLAKMETAITEATVDAPDIVHTITGMVPSFQRTQQAVVDSLIRSFGIAFITIAIVMVIVLRSFWSGLLAMLPNLQPVALVFGFISLIGVPVDIGTMITASVALGIAVDGTLHLLTWFRDGIRHGLSREDAIAKALAQCAPAMWQTSATIAIGMAMLGFADLLLVSRFGLLMAALVSMALFADIVYLPALLSGGLGDLIEKTVRGNASVTAAPSDGPEVESTP
ncbi:MAG: MMPL family transporter [Planctomycetaceae bacterium]